MTVEQQDIDELIESMDLDANKKQIFKPIIKAYVKGVEAGQIASTDLHNKDKILSSRFEELLNDPDIENAIDQLTDVHMMGEMAKMVNSFDKESWEEE